MFFGELNTIHHNFAYSYLDYKNKEWRLPQEIIAILILTITILTVHTLQFKNSVRIEIGNTKFFMFFTTSTTMLPLFKTLYMNEKLVICKNTTSSSLFIKDTESTFYIFIFSFIETASILQFFNYFSLLLS